MKNTVSIYLSGLVKMVLQAVFFPLRMLGSLILLPYSIIPYAKLIGIDLAPSQQSLDNVENTLVYVPGNGQTKSDPFGRAHIHFAPPGRSIFHLFSLKEAAKDLARYLQDLENRENVKKIHLAGISVGGATIILALDYLDRHGIQLTKLKKVLVMNTFRSFVPVIENILRSDFMQLYSMPLFEIALHVLYSLLIGSPISVFSVLLANVVSVVILSIIGLLVDWLSINNKISDKLFRGYIKNELFVGALIIFGMVMLLNTSAALSSIICYQALTIVLPAVLLYEISIFVKMFLWIMDSDLDVHAAYLRIKGKAPDLNLTVQQVSHDQVIGDGAKLLEDPSKQLNISFSAHLFTDPLNVRNISDFS